MFGEISIGLAFIAGFLSFVSPCVLPLVPAYIGYLGGRMSYTIGLSSGRGTAEASALAGRANVLLHGMAFVLGFTLVFVLIGLMTTALVSVVGGTVSILTDIIARIGGVLIIFFGLHFMGVLRALFQRLQAHPQILTLPFSVVIALAVTGLLIWGFVDPVLALPVIALWWLWLVIRGAFMQPQAFWLHIMSRLETMIYTDTRRNLQPQKHSGLPSSFIMGVVFSAGWTPCIGPLLGAILTLAANTGDVGQAGVLLTAYSMGLGIPFLATAFMLDSAQGLLRRAQRYMRSIELFSGSLLVFVGVLVASGQLTLLTQNLNTQYADFSYRLEECGIGFFEGELRFEQVGACLDGSLVPVALGQGMPGMLDSERRRMEFLFHIEAPGLYEVELRGASAGLQPTLRLINESGEEIAQQGWTALPEEERFVALPPSALETPGKYSVIIEDAGSGGTFRLQIRAAQAQSQSSNPPIENIASTGSGSVVSEVASTGLQSIEALAAQAGPAEGVRAGLRAPDFQVVSLQGETVQLSDLRGKVVLLNFWGTWCGPCRREMPELQAAYDRYADDGLVILALAVRDEADLVRAFREEFGLTFTLALDEGERVSSTFKVPGQPSTFIIDQNGVIQQQYFNLLTADQLEEALAPFFMQG